MKDQGITFQPNITISQFSLGRNQQDKLRKASSVSKFDSKKQFKSQGDKYVNLMF
jgi:hypothetical protein